MAYVAHPMLRFQYTEPAAPPEAWAPGEYTARLKAFGFLPLGEQVLVIEFPPVEGSAYRVRDNGRGKLARVWDHIVTIEPMSKGRCRYTDEVTVEAGVLTPIVWAFAWMFYRHRQRRWEKLVATGFDYSG